MQDITYLIPKTDDTVNSKNLPTNYMSIYNVKKTITSILSARMHQLLETNPWTTNKGTKKVYRLQSSIVDH